MDNFDENSMVDFEEDSPAAQGFENISVTLPEFYNWSTKSLYDYESNIIDYSSFEDIEKVMAKVRKTLFLINDKLNVAERKEKAAKIKYDRAYRREYLASTEKTETAKRARASLKCEELENEYLMYEQLKVELTRVSYTIRSELQTLNTLTYNLRTQLKNL